MKSLKLGFPRAFLIIIFFGLFSGQITYARAKVSAEHEIASRFAPVFHQALGDNPRSDYITKFDFDGDWRGDNNWENAGDQRYGLRAYVYYAMSETATHHFIHYAVFHPRDYKGGEQQGRLWSQVLRQGAKIVGDKDPTGMLRHATAAHENDMEGCLVVIAKNGDGSDDDRVAFVETLAHNSFELYSARENRPQGVNDLGVEDARPVLYIEPRGHGIKAYLSRDEYSSQKDFLIYRYTGQAEDPEKIKGETIGYELLPIKTTLWTKAVGLGSKKGTTYGDVHDYAVVSINVVPLKGVVVPRKIKVGRLGSTFLGVAGGDNMARPPWGWFDTKRREDPLGLWFFDPAKVIKRDFELGDEFSTTYLKLPFWAAK